MTHFFPAPQVFNDFAPSMLFLDPSAVVTRQILGDGGFGTVYAGTINRGVSENCLCLAQHMWPWAASMAIGIFETSADKFLSLYFCYHIKNKGSGDRGSQLPFVAPFLDGPNGL